MQTQNITKHLFSDAKDQTQAVALAGQVFYPGLHPHLSKHIFLMLATSLVLPYFFPVA